jgi:hypothetical protein
MQRVSGMDAAFLNLETPTAHMHVIGDVILDPSTAPASDGGFGFSEIEAALRDRFHLIPPFRRRAVPPPGKIDHPVWMKDPEFDLAKHVTRAQLPAPMSWKDLERSTCEFAGIELQRDRPLWAISIVQVLEDGQVAMVPKLHHAIMDSAAGGELMASLFDLTSDVGSTAPAADPWAP